jgi:DNA-binding response OmpR family regulator
VMLPFFDGFQLVRILRAQPGWETVPVIMLTAKTQESDIVRALDAGANDYIVKPFQPKELLARVRRLARLPQ